MNLIYIGDHFYRESGTMMSPIYTTDGQRSDWGAVEISLRNGDEVHIRQATTAEFEFYEKKLKEQKKRLKRAMEATKGEQK